MEPYLEGEPFIRGHFGKDADTILKYTDLPVVIESIKKLLKYNIFEKKVLQLTEIESHIKKGHVVMALIDNNKIISKEGYQGHFVILTGFDHENVFYHDSGPRDAKPDKRISKSAFMEACSANGTDNDIVIVSGKISTP